MNTNHANAARKLLKVASWVLIGSCLAAAPIVASVSWLAALSLVSTASTTYLLMDDE